jgi:hypothetical protein
MFVDKRSPLFVFPDKSGSVCIVDEGQFIDEILSQNGPIKWVTTGPSSNRDSGVA